MDRKRNSTSLEIKGFLRLEQRSKLGYIFLDYTKIFLQYPPSQRHFYHGTPTLFLNSNIHKHWYLGIAYHFLGKYCYTKIR